MKSAGFVPIIDVRPCPRPLTLGLQRQVHVHQVSRALTIPHVIAPQPPHKTAKARHSTRSEGLDRIFRNEESRVQIPSAPLNALVRAISDRIRLIDFGEE